MLRIVYGVSMDILIKFVILDGDLVVLWRKDGGWGKRKSSRKIKGSGLGEVGRGFNWSVKVEVEGRNGLKRNLGLCL